MSEVIQQEFVKILRRCEIFIGLYDDDLEKVALLPSTHLETYEVDEIITQGNESAINLYILVEGKVDLQFNMDQVIEGKTGFIKIDSVSTGSVFGWSALVQPYVYTLRAICSQLSTVLAINGRELIHLMDEDEHIGYEVMRSIACVISSRLRIPNKYFWSELFKERNSNNKL